MTFLGDGQLEELVKELKETAWQEGAKAFNAPEQVGKERQATDDAGKALMNWVRKTFAQASLRREDGHLSICTNMRDAPTWCGMCRYHSLEAHDVLFRAFRGKYTIRQHKAGEDLPG